MKKRLVFLYDSTVEPWHVDLQALQSELASLAAKGVTCQLLDTRGMSAEELDRWRDKATTAAVWRHQGIRQMFGSRRQAGLPYFGRQVPALLVYEQGERIPVGVYPHREKRGETRTDFTIQGFLQQLIDSLSAVTEPQED